VGSLASNLTEKHVARFLLIGVLFTLLVAQTYVSRKSAVSTNALQFDTNSLGNIFFYLKSGEMKISDKGLRLIKRFEGYRSRPYRCPAGKLSIGYGHVIGSNSYPYENILKALTKEQAEDLLIHDLQVTEKYIAKTVKVFLTQGQYDSLVSLVYNWGIYNFSGSVGLTKLNTGDYNGAKRSFFNRKGGVVLAKGKVLNGLVKRRNSEAVLWQYGMLI